MLKKVRISISTVRQELTGSLSDPLSVRKPLHGEAPSRISVTATGRLLDDGSRVTLSYEESELTGLAGSTTALSYSKAAPNTISLRRTGAVRTALLFEPGTRDESVYDTAYMRFEVLLHTHSVQNELDTKGTLTLEYDLELRGAQTERTTLSLCVLPDFDKPLTIK